MEYKFKRDLRNSFMIADVGFDDVGYERDILMNNDIDVLVPFHTVSINNNMQVWYDITGLVSLKDYLMQQGITLDLIRKVLVYLKIAIDETQRYLIDVNHLMIDVNSIFVVKNNNEWKLMLIYYPISEEETGLNNLMEFFMENADDRIMDTCFRLYDASVEGVGIDGIIDRLDAKSSIDNVAVTVEESYEEIEEDKTYSDREDNSFIKERSIFDSYEDDGNIFDEDDEPTLFERIREMLQNRLKREDKKSFSIFKSTPKPEKIRSIKKNNKSKWGRKKEVEISEDFEEDFQYDPNQQIYEPTVLLRSFDESSDDISRSGGLLGELEYIGDSKKDNIKIDKDIFLLGSAKEGNDSVIDSPVVSRFHAKIIREGRSYYIEDLNSTNGTTVNGELIGYQDKVELKSDDVVMFADERYKVI